MQMLSSTWIQDFLLSRTQVVVQLPVSQCSEDITHLHTATVEEPPTLSFHHLDIPFLHSEYHVWGFLVLVWIFLNAFVFPQVIVWGKEQCEGRNDVWFYSLFCSKAWHSLNKYFVNKWIKLQQYNEVQTEMFRWVEKLWT